SVQKTKERGDKERERERERVNGRMERKRGNFTRWDGCVGWNLYNPIGRRSPLGNQINGEGKRRGGEQVGRKEAF
ncbi:unnamed protein product, partial [Musa banksii]